MSWSLMILFCIITKINGTITNLNNQSIVLNHFCMPWLYDLNSFLHFQDNLYNFLVILYSVFSSLRSNLLCKPESNKVIIK